MEGLRPIRRTPRRQGRADRHALGARLAQIQHGYAFTEYRELGSKRYAEIHMVGSLVHQRSLTVGMTRHTHRYSMHYSAEKVGSFENLVAFGERERNKVSLDDFTVRDIAAERRTELRDFFKNVLPKGAHTKYSSNTTHMGKLIPLLQGGGGGGCPILVFGLTPQLYEPNS